MEIINQVILLYDNGHYTLEKPKSLSSKKRQQKAPDYFEDWFESGSRFYSHFSYDLKKHGTQRQPSIYIEQLRNTTWPSSWYLPTTN